MNKFLILPFLALALFSCTDTKKQEETLLAEVIKVHDEVMSKEELIMHNKMKLDTLITQTSDSSLKSEATALRTVLDSADSKMENWMHKFDAENKGKSHDEIMKYLDDQKKQITAIDQNYNAIIATADAFVKTHKIK